MSHSTKNSRKPNSASPCRASSSADIALRGRAGAAGRRGVLRLGYSRPAHRPLTATNPRRRSDSGCSELGLFETEIRLPRAEVKQRDPGRVRSSGVRDTITGLGLELLSPGHGAGFWGFDSHQTGRWSADQPGRGGRHERWVQQQWHFR